MSPSSAALPSWRPGPTRDKVVGFLEAAQSIPPQDRLACFDNDGTLWCEKPSYVQLDFLLDALAAGVAADPTLGEKPEFAALLSGDTDAQHELGLRRIAMALTGLFEGMTSGAFGERVRDFMARADHRTLHRPLRTAVYQPMLELVAELRRLDFTVAVVTGGGTEFVRAISHDLYGVPPEHVVGTLVEYDYAATDVGPTLTRSNRILGDANEGPAKVTPHPDAAGPSPGDGRREHRG